MKKLISVMLALLMVISVLPTYAVMSFAEEPSFAGPNDSDHSYLDIHSNGEKYSLYFKGNAGDAKIEGVSYDLATNTLTLDNYNEPSTIIEAGEMGADFKIAVIGENYIKAISIFADRYMGSLTIVGDGSLSVNANKDLDDIPVYIDANYTGSVLEVEDSVKLAVYVNGDETAIKVHNSLNENPIICANTETRICDFDSSYTNKKWIYAKDTQMNTFFKVKDSDSYVTYCYDEYSGSDALCEFVLVNRNIDGEEVIFADQTMDEMGNPIIIPDDSVNFSENVRVHQIMHSFERAAVEKAGDETEYTLSEYTNNNIGPFFDVHKVIHDEELGTFFYPVALELTEEPTEYSYIYEEVRESFKYIEYDFANFEIEEPSETDFTFTAKVKDCDITYHNGDNIYIEAGKTELICFEVFDDEGVPYVPTWYSFDMADSGFEIAPEPVVIDDIYYASITNNAVFGNTGTLIVNAFSAEKFADPAFDFITTQPDATFELNIVSAQKYSGVVMVQGKEYPENSTITMQPDESIEMYYLVPGYPGYCIHTINPDLLTEAGFTFEQKFDEEDMPYAVISSNGLKPGTKATVPLAIKRIEDCVINDFNFAITPSIYEYAVTITVECINHSFTNYIFNNDATCTQEGTMTAKCDYCDATDTVLAENTIIEHKFSTEESTQNSGCVTYKVTKYTCDTCGYEKTETEAVATSHIYNVLWVWESFGDVEAVFTCRRCDESDLRHASVSAKTIRKATCNEPGLERYTATVYFNDAIIYTNSKDRTVELAHKIVNGKLIPATCQRPAQQEEICELCGELMDHDEVGEKLPHTSDKGTVTKKATCTAAGTKTYKCTSCGDVLKTETIEAAGHKEVVLKAVTATAKKSGLTAGKKCSVCGKVLVAQKMTLAQVTGLKASAVAETSIKLTWTKIAGAKYYKVEQSTDGKTWKAIKTVDANSYTVSKLKAGTKYQFRVTALDGTKRISGKASAILKTGTLTSAPTVTLKSSKSKTAVATWKKVTGATSYIVYKSTDGKKWTKVTATTARTCSITKLTGGKKIYVKVTAVNAYSKESAASSVKNVTVKK